MQGNSGLRISGFFGISDFGLRISVLALALVLVGCSPKTESPAPPAASAQALFDRASTNFHLPSAQAQGAEKARLLEQAAAAYVELLTRQPEDAHWAAQALRNLGNVRAEQGRTNEAVKLYASVEQRYPQQRWEVLAALKSAGDLLWDASRRKEARMFYEKIVAQFDTPQATQVEKTILRGARVRLAEEPPPAGR
jgi:tetratricopeptide (TPR) repeat protein